MDHVKLEMEEFMPLGGLWAPTDLTFDVSHFDDLDVLGAQDGGLYNHSFKPEPEADPAFELHDLLDVQGCLGLDWLEQPYLPSQSPEREEPCAGESIAGLLGDGPKIPAVSNPEGDVNPKPLAMSTDAALQLLASLKRQQEEVMSLDSSVITSPVSFEVRVEVPLSSTPPSPVAQVTPEIDIAMIDSDETRGLEEVLGNSTVEFLQSPLSPVEIESLLSTPSPSVSPAPSTIDSASLYSPGSSILCSSSDLDSPFVCNTSDLYEVVSNDGSKSRGCPYSRPQGSTKSSKSKGRKQTASVDDGPSGLEIELMSKKDRKKLQNKNAAIRYRQKKKAESEVKKSEEDQLEDENLRLKERVEELSREIGYMKGLINEVRKARGLAPHKSCQ